MGTHVSLTGTIIHIDVISKVIDVVQRSGADPATERISGKRRRRVGHVARVLQGSVDGLQEHALLRIHRSRLSARDVEELGVKEERVLDKITISRVESAATALVLVVIFVHFETRSRDLITNRLR